MNPLYRNDAPGAYPPSWYAASTDLPAPRPALDGDARADVVVVGAGYCGLWAALTLARWGLNVVVLDAHRVGFGASGRNGGQVGSGFNMAPRKMAARWGLDRARALWGLVEEAKSDLRAFCETEAPDARYRPGVAHGAYSGAEVAELQAEARFAAEKLDYPQVETFEKSTFRDLVKSPLYHGGVLDMGAGHLHPLRYALALARAAEAAGARIFERTEATRIAPGSPVAVTTPHGTVRADFAVLAGNGYFPDLVPAVSARVMPINSFIGATPPLGERQREVLARDIAVADSKFVVNYYRFSEDGRFLFGGRESYGLGFPSDIATALRRRMTGLFPQLEGVGFEHVWGGTLGITMPRLPFVARVGDNVLSASGFSGHGVAIAGIAGRAMAEAIAGQAGRFDILSDLPVGPFPGGATFRAPLLTLAMTWYALRDRLGI